MSVLSGTFLTAELLELSEGRTGGKSAGGKSKSKTGLGYREIKTIYEEVYETSITFCGSQMRDMR